METNQLIEKIRTLIDNKRGSDIEILEITEKTTLADYFILASADSNVQVNAIANEILYVLKNEDNIVPLRVEGLDSGRWVLLDFANIWVHLFHKEERAYYKLDDLWK